VAARDRAGHASQAVREKAVAAEQAFDEHTEKAAHELAREARKVEREQGRRAQAKAREPYEGLTKAELSDRLAKRGLPKTGNVEDLIERLVESDAK
jgi:F0F1-type ATP synthase membrane subunit b/b'